MSNTSLESLLENFGVATVMNICVFKLDEDIYNHNRALSSDSFKHLCESKEEERAESKLLFLDTLKISNLSESGPQKTFKAGKINIPIIRHGKQTTLNINDALGRLQTLVHFFGLKRMENFAAYYSTEDFVEPLALEGEMKIVNLKGETETLYLFIPCFVPDGKLTLTQDAEGAFGVFDLSGQLFPVRMKKAFLSENQNGEHYILLSSEYDMILDGFNNGPIEIAEWKKGGYQQKEDEYTTVQVSFKENYDEISGTLTITRTATRYFNDDSLITSDVQKVVTKYRVVNYETIYSKYIIGQHPFISEYEQTATAYIYEFDKVAAVPSDLTTYDDTKIYNEDSIEAISVVE